MRGAAHYGTGWIGIAGVLACCLVAACAQRDDELGTDRDASQTPSLPQGPLAISEVMSNNDAAWVDELGETEDFIELVNISHAAVHLEAFSLRDESGKTAPLPRLQLLAGQRIVLFADDSAEQGELHMPFKLSSEGETLELLQGPDAVIDRVEIPALDVNVGYARFPDGTGDFAKCRYATVGRDNGEQCGPPAPPTLPEDTRWKPFTWPTDALAPAGPLVVSELALHPARFVEVVNASDHDVSLTGHSVELGALGPDVPFPKAGEGVVLDWQGKSKLAPGARIALPVTEDQVADIAATGVFEGVVSVFDAEGFVEDRVDFMRWPKGAALARMPDATGALRFCAVTTEGKANDDCQPLASREVGDRLRHLYTPGDYDALSEGDSQLGLRGLKFVVDMESGDAVHFLSTRDWALHYTWIREKIDGDPPLDRCIPEQSAEFKSGWQAFSKAQYFVSEGRRYLLGTLDLYAGSGLRVMDFAVGDAISGAQMKRAFFDVLGHADAEDVTAWSLRPSEPRQVAQLRNIEGQVPIVAQNAPFRGVTYQPLTPGVAYGQLQFVPADELPQASLGFETIVVTDGVPIDIPFVGGLVTEAFQAPLAHVNVLSQNRKTPNMALADARHDPRFEKLFGKLVRLEVTSTDFTLRAAAPTEAETFWDSRTPKGPPIAPRLDLGPHGVVDLRNHGLADLPAIGAKAAQLAELLRTTSTVKGCEGPLPVPDLPFAIPLAHYVEHFDKSGARKLLVSFMSDPEFRADAVVRERDLAKVRDKIRTAPLDPTLLAQVRSAVTSRFGDAHVRFRSSSNTEDLPGFNGAGLYESIDGELTDSQHAIEDAIRGVWASLWNTRAYDEREHGHIDQLGVAMGVLVHPAFVGERANIIGISRDLLDPSRTDIQYLNAQLGEASVALPAPGVVTEQLIHRMRRTPGTPENEYQSKSSLSHGQDVLTLEDIRAISCRLEAIHEHFQALLDPKHDNRWFAMDVEMKLVGEDRHVVIKQARPYSFATTDMPADCRDEF